MRTTTQARNVARPSENLANEPRNPAVGSTDAATGQRAGPGANVALAALLALWAAGVIGATGAGIYDVGPGGFPLAILLSVMAPPILFVAAYCFSRAVHDWAHGIDLGLLTAMQGWRVIGIAMLVLHSAGQLPAFFAYAAGVGDVLVGLMAPFALLALMRRAPGWRARVLWLNIAGMIDFVGALGSGLAASSSAFGVFRDALTSGALTSDAMFALPMVLIPAFGVPIFMVAHFISFVQLARLRQPTHGLAQPA